jgi:hypothetical protein
MIKFLRFGVFFLMLGSLNDSRANTKVVNTDSISCCQPDSLRFVSSNYPVFCVQWQYHVDSSCHAPLRFEIQWKPLLGFLWKSKFVTFTGSEIINFCDSVDTCGVYAWRVRTWCNDSTFTDWVNGNKFNITSCNHDGPSIPDRIILSPNPTTSQINVSATGIKAGLVNIYIDDINGKRYLNKTLSFGSEQVLSVSLQISMLPKGFFVLYLFQEGRIFGRAKFLKE